MVPSTKWTQSQWEMGINYLELWVQITAVCAAKGSTYTGHKVR